MEHAEEKLIIHPLGNEKLNSIYNPLFPDDICNIKVFSEDEIKIITSNYSIPIGSGAFGHVFKGVVDDDDGPYDAGPYLVAVKRYIHGDSKHKFVKELVLHTQINHKNIVKPIGYCMEESTPVMVTEYISKGNLDDALHNSDISIPLDIRLGIAIGCAKALNYMHSMHLSSGSLVYHGDIKPANILLDDNLTAKVSDFGLSRFLFGGNTVYTNYVIGSIDYMDPIYKKTGCITPRSDVYSFGAVLLELIARRRVKEINKRLISSLCKTKAKVSRELFDAEITNESSVKILEEIARLATECLDLDISKRPKMDVVIERLQAFWRCIRGEQDIGWRKKSFAIFKRTSDNKSSWIHRELSNNNVRILTKEELNLVTQNYSDPLSWQPGVYKGTLEDNTLVVVKKITGLDESSKHEFIWKGILQSQIVHKNMIKILGCCLEADTPIFLYEYATKGNLSGFLNHKEEFPLELRMKIAIGIAKALEHLHSSVTGGTIAHYNVEPSNILLDDNFIPKLKGFSCAWPKTEFKIYEADVRGFGNILLALITRKIFIAPRGHVAEVDQNFSTCRTETEVSMGVITDQLAKAYKKNNSGRPFFDKDITAEEDINVLEELGRLAIRCLKYEENMCGVVQKLQMIKRSWKKVTGKGATQVTGADHTAVYIKGPEDTNPDAQNELEIVLQIESA